MQIRVLGAIDVLDPDDVALGGPTQRRTLSMLSMHADRVVSVDQFVDAVWPDGSLPERAEHNVRTYVHRLRTALGDAGSRIETVGTGYRLRLERNELDASRFEDLVTEARAAAADADHERAQHLLDEALELWGGRPYDEFADEEWARAEVTRLSEVRASAIEHRFAALLDAGRHTEVIGPLREAVTDEPWREARRIQLALALYRSGRQAEALKAIQLYQSELAEELGLEPSPELGQLEHRILEHDPALLPASHQQHMLRGYQLDEVIGEGAFSLVWRGVQPSLGRTVAIKQIRAELANQPDFVRRFETEAQTVAALEHPYIVPLYDYWREPDSAYLVMRYVTGGTLESEVLDHGLQEPRLRRLIDQVGSALSTAHRAGVIHRDVKSANVLSDADGNFYLTDFGIALTGSADDDELATTLSTGSPAYASPEQLRRQGLDDRTDVYGFGITLFEAATGRLPFVDAPTKAALVKRQLEDPVPAPSSVTATVPAWVDKVVARATAKNPADRFGSMAELVAAVPPDATSTVDHGRGVAASTVIGDLVNPFKALRAFREADSADFYGRDRLVSRFIDVLTRPGTAGRLLAVVGPSGSGKSSAVRSGLLPRLRTGAVSTSQDWFITTMLPGSHPFDELESALSRVAMRQPGPLVEMMRGDARGIARAINQILPDEDSELLLVIDQFEEMFTHTDDAERTRFLDGLLAAVREPRSRLRLVVTIRADFLDRPLRHPGLAARLETATITVSPLAADELEAAIVEPVRRQGAVYEPGLVARIMADVGDQPGALPLLQYALTELFDTNVSGLLRAESYDAIGGLTGALGARADDTLEGLTAGQQADARRLFGRLVTFGDGTEDTRRRVRRGELGDGPDTMAVIDTFGAARLLVFDHDPSTREPTVEIAHEALLQAWPRLRGWLDEDRDGLRVHRHLTDTTAAWLALGRDEGELYRGGRLETATAWAADHGGDLNQAEREFFDASVATHDAELAAEQEQLDTTIRSNRRLRVLASAATVIAVIAAIAGVFALQQRSRAELALERADFDRLVALARTTDPTDPTIGLLLAVETQRMWEEGRSADLGLERESQRFDALHFALTARSGFEGWLASDPVGYITTLDDGVRIVTYTTDTIDVWNLATRERETSWPHPNAAGPQADIVRLTGVASTDGTLFAAGEPSGITVIDLATGEHVLRIDHESFGPAVAFSPDGSKLATGFQDGVVEVWEIGGGDEPVASRQGGPVGDVAWRPDGAALAIGTVVNGLTLWEPANDTVVWELGGDAPFVIDNGAWGLLFSSDGERLVVSMPTATDSAGVAQATGERAVWMLDAATGSELTRIIDPFTRIAMEWLNEREESVVALHTGRGPVATFDVVAGEPIAELGEIKTGFSFGLGVLRELDLVATGGPGGIELRSLDGSGPLSVTAPLPRVQREVVTPQTVLAPAFSDDDRLAISTLPNRSETQLVDLARPARPAEPLVQDDNTTSTVVFRSRDFSIHEVDEGFVVRDGLVGPPLGPIVPRPDGPVNSFWVSPAGDRLVIVVGTSANLYDVVTGEFVTELDPGFDWSGQFVGGEFAPDGSTVIMSSGFDAAMFDGVNGALLWASNEIGSAYLTPDGGALLTTQSPSEAAVIYRSPDEPFEPTGDLLSGHAGGTSGVLFHPSRDWAATDGRDGTVRLWDLGTTRQLGRSLPALQQGYTTWSPDGRLLAVASPDGFAVWNYDVDTWVEIACRVAGRNLTAGEWEEFGPSTVEYRATCPEFGI